MRPDEETTPSPDEEPTRAEENREAAAEPVTPPAPPPEPVEPEPPIVEPPAEPEPAPPAPEAAPVVEEEASVEDAALEPEPEFVAEAPAAPQPAPPPEPEVPASVAFEEQMFGEAPAEETHAYEAPVEEAAYDDHATQPAYEAQRYDEQRYTQEPAYEEPAQQYDYAPEAEPNIPLPGEAFGDPRRARDAQSNLDLDLSRIKRRKRYGLFLTTLTVLFVAFFVAPVTWAAAYLFFDPPSNVLMMQRAAEGQTIQHTPVPITRMSPYIVRSVIAAEDANFCTHHGFDVAAIQNALESNADGGKVRGGSTISQQTAKNLFLWPQRSWVRKGFETYFTALIEFMWPKRRIMEAYLNTAEWGDGIFGIEAASRARFGVAASDLTPLQAARLASVLPSPNRWSATSPGPYVRGRAASIVARAQVVRNQHMAGCVLSMDAAPQP